MPYIHGSYGISKIYQWPKPLTVTKRVPQCSMTSMTHPVGYPIWSNLMWNTMGYHGHLRTPWMKHLFWCFLRSYIMFAFAKAPKPSACRKDMVAPGGSRHEVSIILNNPYKTCIVVWLRQMGTQFFNCLHDLLTHQGADTRWNHLGTSDRCVNSWSILRKGRAILKLTRTKTLAGSFWKSLKNSA